MDVVNSLCFTPNLSRTGADAEESRNGTKQPKSNKWLILMPPTLYLLCVLCVRRLEELTIPGVIQELDDYVTSAPFVTGPRERNGSYRST